MSRTRSALSFLDGKVGMIQAGSGAANLLKKTKINWGRRRVARSARRPRDPARC